MPVEIQKRNKLLKKVRLVFEKNLILIENDELWKKVSMIERVSMKMPSTASALEGIRGHLNSRIPKFNIFWNAFYRLAQNFILKNNCLNDQILHNYNIEKRRKISHALYLQKRIEDEIKYYHSTKNECQCGGNRLISKISITVSTYNCLTQETVSMYV